jgi:hypothetical protein
MPYELWATDVGDAGMITIPWPNLTVGQKVTVEVDGQPPRSATVHYTTPGHALATFDEP